MTENCSGIKVDHDTISTGEPEPVRVGGSISYCRYMYFPKHHKLYDCHIQNFISSCHTFIAIDTRHTSESHSCSQPKPSQLQSFITSNTNNFPNQLSLNVSPLTLVFRPITTLPVPNTQLQLYHVTISSLT